MKQAKKNNENTLDIIARNVAEIKAEMATKDDLRLLEQKIDKRMDKLELKIDSVGDNVQSLEEGEVRDLQKRVFVLERDMRHLIKK